jgi:antitoxin component of RelBE/YafQ-DinJ toxin-antitoxin module
METITVTIKNTSKQAKALLEVLKAFPFVEIVEHKTKEQPRYNAETEKAIRDYREGKLKIIKAKNATELMKKLRA